MVDYKSSPASPKSPDHDYFPKHLFRRSKASDEVPPSPISGRAAGKARAQQSSPLIQLQSQTPVAPAFPTPVHPNSQQYHTSQQQQRGPYSYIPLNLDDRNQDRLSQTHNLLSDAPLEDENAKHYSYASTYSPEIKSAEEADQEVREAQMKRARKWQKIDKYIGYTLGLISLTLSLMMDAILAYVLHTFYKTKDIPAPGRVGPWAVGTQLWPAYMLLAASSVTFLVDGSTLVAACCVLRSERKRKGKEKSKADGEKVVAARAESALVKAGYVAFVAKWFIIATLYRTGKTSKDLWGWSCDKRAANIQKYYVNDLNFATLCRAQTGAWAMSITEMILKLLLMAFIFWLGYKLRELKKAKQEEIKEGKMAEGHNDTEAEQEPKMGIQRPPSVIWYSLIEASRMLGQSGK